MEWQVKKLGEVCEIYQPQTITSNEITKEGAYKVFGANGVIGYYSKYNHENAEVLVTCRGATCGTLNMSESKSWITGNAMVIHPKDEKILLKPFLFYTLKNSNLSRIITGTGQPQITRNSLAPFLIPLLPLTTQKQIVERLDKIAEAQKLNDELIQKSDELFQSLLHNELNLAGKSWEIKKLGDIAETSSGGTPLKEKMEFYENGTTPWLRSGEVSQGLIYRSELFITENGLKHSSAKIFPIDTILVAMYGATAGQVGLLKFEASTNQAICGIFPNDKKFISEYLYYFLKTKTKYLIEMSTGGAQPNISQTIIRNLKVPLPDLKIQKQIVAKLSAVQEHKTQLLAQKSKLKELFDSALAKSFSGQ